MIARVGIAVALLAGTMSSLAQQATILEVENTVQSSKAAGDRTWRTAQAGENLAVRDQVRTRRRSRAMVRISELYTMRLDQFTTVEISPRLVGSERPTLDILRGVSFIFSREEEGEIDIKTPTANAALEGTQLIVEVGENGKTTITVIEGRVRLSNDFGELFLNAGEAGEAEKGKAPRRTAVIEGRNLVQWALYYPGVLSPDSLQAEALGEPLRASVASYRQGDLPRALELLPDRAGGTQSERLYRAQVLLAVGRVDEAQTILRGLPNDHAGRRALERLIAAVTLDPQNKGGFANARAAAGQGAVESALAESYYRQAVHDLEGARALARQSVEAMPGNGYGWARLAELEFSFGDNKRAQAALDKALELTPRNAQAHALRGFMLAATNDLDVAERSFQQALEIDGALGNGWLGRGLVRIRRGDLARGRLDLQSAATVEPTRAIFHSYLGKAFSEEGEGPLAKKDFGLAKQLDPLDPTPWLYSAIQHQRENQPNRAIRDLGQSVRLNDNRRVYRSQLLLDQDRAVRSTNLAQMYQDAGMKEVAVREATRAVENDYTNASAHLFLANSFDALRDPTRIELRYETPWFHELLMANLLSPVGGGQLSQFVSQQEYSKLFASDGMGASILSEARSDGELRTTASVFGTHGRTSYGVDIDFRDDDGDRLNSDDYRLEIYTQFKHEVTPADTLYFLGKWQEMESGDTRKFFSDFDLAGRPAFQPGLRFEEDQEPGLLLAGWNHRWRPGSNTLFLGGRLGVEQTLRDPRANQLLVQRSTEELPIDDLRVVQNSNNSGVSGGRPPLFEVSYSDELRAIMDPLVGTGAVAGVNSAAFDFFTRRDWEVYSAEIQHIEQTHRNTLLGGARFQTGELETEANLDLNRPNFTGFFPIPASAQRVTTDYERISLYAYDYFELTPELTLIGGASWDHVDHPDNFRNPPVNDQQRTDEQFSGKLGFSYTPSPYFSLRGVFAEALGGLSFDESVTLEPVQLAGFNQAYRTVLSESLQGSVETPEFTILGLSADGMLPTETWWGASISLIEQDVDRSLGVFTGYDVPFWNGSPAYFPDTTGQLLDYEELAFEATVNQLLCDQFSLGLLYRVTNSELHSRLPDIPTQQFLFADLTDEATLHEVSLFGNWNSPSGLFARLEANWYSQDLDDDPARVLAGQDARSGDEFWHLNAFLGYRFNDNAAEISVGVLNINDASFNLSPLNTYGDMPQERTAIARCRFVF